MIDDANLASYQSVPLVSQEVELLEQLEDMIGISIPAGRIGFYTTGFKYKQHHVSGLSLHNQELESLDQSFD